MTSNNKKTICLITDTYWPVNGGVESWVHAYSVLLSSHHNITIIAHANTPCLKGILSRTIFLHSFKPYYDDAHNMVKPLAPSLIGRFVLLPFLIWLFPFIKRLGAKPIFDFLYFFYRKAMYSKLCSLLKNADLVHCFSTSHLAICATEVCKDKNIPVIQSPPVHFGKWGDTPLLLQSYRRANAIVCLSESFKTGFQKLCGTPNASIFVIPALTLETSIVDEPVKLPCMPFVLFLGRREKHKGLDMLCKAFSALSVQASLVIAGPGTRLPFVAANITDLSEVRDSQKQWLLKNCAVLCVPSSDESFGIVYIEAMKQAKPVIALNVAPVNEVIIHNETGLLVEPDNAIELTAALASILTDTTLKDSFGKNGQLRYKALYDSSVITKNIMHIYSSFL